MKCMVGLLHPDNGEVLYDGKNFTNMRLKKERGSQRDRHAFPGIGLV